MRRSGRPKTLTCEQWFYQLIRQELNRQRRSCAEERSRRIEPAPREGASTDGADEGYGAEWPLGIIASEIEPEEDLPEHHIPDRAIVPPDPSISGKELVEILQEKTKYWPADEQQVFELYFLVVLPDLHRSISVQTCEIAFRHSPFAGLCRADESEACRFHAGRRLDLRN